MSKRKKQIDRLRGTAIEIERDMRDYRSLGSKCRKFFFSVYIILRKNS